MKPYEFAIVRYQHDASIGERMNIGVLVWSPEDSALHFRVNERYGRLSRTYPGFDGTGYRQMVRQLATRLAHVAESLAAGQADLFAPGGAHGLQAVLDRVLPEDASCLQRSEVMGGIYRDPRERCDQLFHELVARHEANVTGERREESQVWASMKEKLRARGLLDRMQRHVEVRAADYGYRFHAGWQNGELQVVEPISLDCIEDKDVVERANLWGGRLLSLSRGPAFRFTAVVARPQRGASTDAFNHAMGILRQAPRVRQVLDENEFDDFLPELEREIAAHG